MKTLLIAFCSFVLVATITLFAYNADKGPAKQKDGIAELSQTASDSLIQRGKVLLSKTNYTDQDLQAIAAYLNNK